MLSAAKIKIHGMQDERWAVKDKITQFRGVISLYERDRKLFESDQKQQKKRYARDIKHMRNDIDVKREELGVAVHGDKQFIRNVLQDHRKLQLAYMDSHAADVLECIHQENFNRRKQLDRIEYDKKKKMERFRELQLQEAEIKDRILYESNEIGPIKLKEQAFSNYVQCANIKKNAALAIKDMYIQMLDILKKDSAYFTVVLEALKLDCKAQGKCLMGATEMGQLCMEYLDDRKFEYLNLEKQIKINMKERASSLKNVQKKVESLTNCFTNLMETNEQVSLDALFDDDETSNPLSVHAELEDVKATCKSLQREIKVSSFEEVLPRLKNQDDQSERLRVRLMTNIMFRDSLIEDHMHANIILENLKNKGQQETKEYLREKTMIRDSIRLEREEKEKLRQRVHANGVVLMNIRWSLQRLADLVSAVGVPAKSAGKKGEIVENYLKQISQDSPQAVPPVENDLNKLISLGKQKITVLASSLSKVEINQALIQKSQSFYQNLIMRMMRANFVEEVVAEASLIEFETDDPNVPSNRRIKIQSKQLVDAQVSEFDA